MVCLQGAFYHDLRGIATGILYMYIYLHTFAFIHQTHWHYKIECTYTAHDAIGIDIIARDGEGFAFCCVFSPSN